MRCGRPMVGWTENIEAVFLIVDDGYVESRGDSYGRRVRRNGSLD